MDSEDQKYTELLESLYRKSYSIYERTSLLLGHRLYSFASSKALPSTQMSIDRVDQFRERLAAPKSLAPTLAEDIELEIMRNLMVRSANRKSMSVDVEMKSSMEGAMCLAGYLAMCISREKFRANVSRFCRIHAVKPSGISDRTMHLLGLNRLHYILVLLYEVSRQAILGHMGRGRCIPALPYLFACPSI